MFIVHSFGGQNIWNSLELLWMRYASFCSPHSKGYILPNSIDATMHIACDVLLSVSDHFKKKWSLIQHTDIWYIRIYLSCLLAWFCFCITCLKDATAHMKLNWKSNCTHAVCIRSKWAMTLHYHKLMFISININEPNFKCCMLLANSFLKNRVKSEEIADRVKERQVVDWTKEV